MWGYNGKGNKGSYYWYHDGNNKPEIETSKIIESFLSKSYDKIYMLGSSKGGSAAIYYGLKYNVDVVISAACQYNVGNYLSSYDRILYGMMGNIEKKEAIKILNNKLRNTLQTCQKDKINIILYYSKLEHTYEDDIIDLLSDLKIYNYNFTEVIEEFRQHSEVGIYFAKYLTDFFRNKNNFENKINILY